MFNSSINASPRQTGKTTRMKKEVETKVLDLIRESNKIYIPNVRKAKLEKRYIYAMADLETYVSNIESVINEVVSNLYTQTVGGGSIGKKVCHGVTNPILSVEIGDSGLQVVFYTIGDEGGYVKHRIMLVNLSAVLKANKEAPLSSLIDEMLETLRAKGITTASTVTDDGVKLYTEINLYIDDLLTDDVDCEKTFSLLANSSSNDRIINVEINRVASTIPDKSENEEDTNGGYDIGPRPMRVLTIKKEDFGKKIDVREVFKLELYDIPYAPCICAVKLSNGKVYDRFKDKISAFCDGGERDVVLEPNYNDKEYYEIKHNFDAKNRTSTITVPFKSKEDMLDVEEVKVLFNVINLYDLP